jgi:hypothetical protein
MNLPDVITALVKAQNNYDAAAYAGCFTETALVFDEGKTHEGKNEIREWIAGANEAYKTAMKPIGYAGTGTAGILKTEVSGTFEGSPVILSYHFELEANLIKSLKIIG